MLKFIGRNMAEHTEAHHNITIGYGPNLTFGHVITNTRVLERLGMFQQVSVCFGW